MLAKSNGSQWSRNMLADSNNFKVGLKVERLLYVVVYRGLHEN